MRRVHLVRDVGTTACGRLIVTRDTVLLTDSKIEKVNCKSCRDAAAPQRPIVLDREAIIFKITMINDKVRLLKVEKQELERRLRAFPKPKEDKNVLHDRALTVLKERHPELFEECLNEAYARIEEEEKPEDA